MKIFCHVQRYTLGKTYVVEIDRDVLPTELEDDLDAGEKILINQWGVQTKE